MRRLFAVFSILIGLDPNQIDKSRSWLKPSLRNSIGAEKQLSSENLGHNKIVE